MAEQTTQNQNFETFLVERGFITQGVYDTLAALSQRENVPIVTLIQNQKVLSSEDLGPSPRRLFE